jgi:hypothetical protein
MRGNARLFKHEPQTARGRVVNVGANERVWTICGRQRPLDTRTGGRGQHAGANIHWVRKQEGADSRAYTRPGLPNVNEVSVHARPHRNVHSTLGVDT